MPAGRRRRLAPGSCIGRATALDRFLARLGGVVGVLQFLEHHGELVAAQACDQILLPHGGAQAPRDLPEQLVPGGVAQRVVHQLEAIEVQEQRQLVPVALRARQGAFEGFPRAGDGWAAR